jgi:dUTP pyrophosphatase
MDKDDLEEYIRKFSSIEKELSDDENQDLSYTLELEKLLQKLSDDIHKHNMSNISNVYNHTEDYFTSINIKIKKLKENAVIPTYSKNGDAGMDLTATEILSEDLDTITYGTGLAFEIPKGYVGLVFPRSSIRKYELQLSNSVGVIDSGYRGEVQATFNKIHNKLENYEVGDRVAQIMIIPYPQIKFIETQELSDTDRGTGGFGSTGS